MPYLGDRSCKLHCKAPLQEAFCRMAQALVWAVIDETQLEQQAFYVVEQILDLVTQESVMKCSRFRSQRSHVKQSPTRLHDALRSLSTLLKDEFTLRELHEGLWGTRVMPGPIRQETHWGALCFLGRALAKLTEHLADGALEDIDETQGSLNRGQSGSVGTLQICKGRRRVLCKGAGKGHTLGLLKTEGKKMNSKLYGHLEELLLFNMFVQLPCQNQEDSTGNMGPLIGSLSSCRSAKGGAVQQKPLQSVRR